MENRTNDEIRQIVREKYGGIAKGCGCSSELDGNRSCCGSLQDTLEQRAVDLGYSKEEASQIPEGANLGLGCGNPIALASLKQGEIVLDLGSGAGFDCFLAASRVGDSGKVIGVDMTPEMLEKARDNARKGNYANVEFRLGEIEHLPVGDNSVDALISNCVINLSPDKRRVFAEAFRALKPGGRLMISDIVLLKELPAFIKNSIEAYIGCVAGAMLKDEYLTSIKEAGFQDVEIMGETAFPMEFMANDPTVKGLVEHLRILPEKIGEVAESIRSIKVYGVKPIVASETSGPSR